MARGHMPRKTKGFASRAQWRLFFANPRLRRYAAKKEDASRPFRSLPARKGARKRA